MSCSGARLALVEGHAPESESHRPTSRRIVAKRITRDCDESTDKLGAGSRTDPCVGECLLPKDMQMLKTSGMAITSLALTVLLLGLSGCRRAGPAERAGRKIDQTVEQAGQQIDSAAERIRNELQGE